MLEQCLRRLSRRGLYECDTNVLCSLGECSDIIIYILHLEHNVGPIIQPEGL